MVRKRLGESRENNVNPKIKHLLLDVLKPHLPDIIDLSKAIAHVKGVKRVTIEIVEIDQDTESIRVEVDGDSIDIVSLKKKINEMGASVHSIDSVTTEIS
jgi:hypothetical protein